MIKAAYPDPEISFDPAPWHRFYFEAWEALRFDRAYLAFGGQMPIPYMTIRAYAHDVGITGEDLLIFRTLLAEIDHEYLKHAAEKAEKSKEGGSDG